MKIPALCFPATCTTPCDGTICHCQSCGKYKPAPGNDYCPICIAREEGYEIEE